MSSNGNSYHITENELIGYVGKSLKKGMGAVMVRDVPKFLEELERSFHRQPFHAVIVAGKLGKEVRLFKKTSIYGVRQFLEMLEQKSRYHPEGVVVEGFGTFTRTDRGSWELKRFRRTQAVD